MSVDDILSRAATESPDFEPVYKQAALQGLTFDIRRVRQVTTQYGDSYIIQCSFSDGKLYEFWFKGVQCERQIEALEREKALPARVRLEREPLGKGTAYILHGGGETLSEPPAVCTEGAYDPGPEPPEDIPFE